MTTWLIDKSALARLATSPDAAEWATRIERGLVRITTVTRPEVGYSARSGPDLRTGFARPPLASMPVEYMTPAIEDRVVEVLTLLADRGQHRAPSVPDFVHRGYRGTRRAHRAASRQGLRCHSRPYWPTCRAPERDVTPSAGPCGRGKRRCEFARPPGSATVLKRASSWSAGFTWCRWGSCGRGSVGRASPCQGEGRGFESRRPLGGVGRRIAVPMASTAPGGPWCGFPGSEHGGVAEWPRQGPAKPCTRVRFPPPPRGRLAQWESATLTR